MRNAEQGAAEREPAHLAVQRQAQRVQAQRRAPARAGGRNRAVSPFGASRRNRCCWAVRGTARVTVRVTVRVTMRVTVRVTA